LQLGTGLTTAKVCEAERFLLPQAAGGTQPMCASMIIKPALLKCSQGYAEGSRSGMQVQVPYPPVAGAARNVVLSMKGTGMDTDLESQERHRRCLDSMTPRRYLDHCDILDKIVLTDTAKHGVVEDFYQLDDWRASSKKSVSFCAPDLHGEESRVEYQHIPGTDGSDRHTVSYLTRNRNFKGASALLEEDRLTGPGRIEECEGKDTMDKAADASNQFDVLSGFAPRAPISPKDSNKLSGREWRFKFDVVAHERSARRRKVDLECDTDLLTEDDFQEQVFTSHGSKSARPFGKNP